MTRKTKILMLSVNSNLMDGINRHILNIAPGLNKQGNFEVAVCTIMPHGEFHIALEQNGVETFALGYPNGHALGIIKAFHRVMKQYKPDIIHSHVMALMERLYLAYNAHGVKIVETIHGISDAKTTFSFRDRVENLIHALSPINFSARCYISNGVRAALEDSLSAVPVNKVCYNPVEFSVISNKDHKLHDMLSIPHNTPIIGTSCRISYVKQPTIFTETMCLVLREEPSAHAVVMGEGDAGIIQKCKKIVTSYDVENRFHWMGYQKDAPTLVRDLNCFVMTSISEGMPTSLLECFACKTPVAILEGEGGLKDIMLLHTDSHPILLHSSQDDYIGLSHEIAALLSNPNKSKSMADNAFKIGKKVFGLENVVDELAKLYINL